MKFPDFERFELSSQLRRAAFSVPANIVEGFARRYRRERLHFLNIAEGSLAEVWQGLHSACRLGYLSKEKFVELETELNAVGAPLTGLVRSIQRQRMETSVVVSATAVLIVGLSYLLF